MSEDKPPQSPPSTSPSSSNPSENNTSQQVPNKNSILEFTQPLSALLGSRLMKALIVDFLPKMQDKIPELSVKPIYTPTGQYKGLDFGIEIDAKLKKKIIQEVNLYLTKIQQHDLKLAQDEEKKELISFSDLLGTYRVRLNRYFFPIFVCIISATVFAWITWNVAQIRVDGGIVDEDTAGPAVLLLTVLFLSLSPRLA